MVDIMLQGLQPDILSVAMMLCQDPTAAVRSAVAKQMGQVVCKLWQYQQVQQQADTAHGASVHVHDAPDNLVKEMNSISLTQDEANDMQQEIVTSLQSLGSQDAYQIRQQYVEVCYHVAIACRTSDIQIDLFQRYLMQTMLELAQDKVANVRLAVARALSNLTELAQLPEVIGVLDMLKRDSDADVASCSDTIAIKS